jgi:hypothetical protein
MDKVSNGRDCVSAPKEKWAPWFSALKVYRQTQASLGPITFSQAQAKENVKHQNTVTPTAESIEMKTKHPLLHPKSS